jgi:hypothetical protein
MLKVLFERMREGVEVMSRFHADRTAKPVMEVTFEAAGTAGILRSDNLSRVLILPPVFKVKANAKAVFNWLKREVGIFVRDSYNAG